MRATSTVLKLTLALGLTGLAACGSGSNAKETDMTSASSAKAQGFVTAEEDGRLWVFRDGSKDLKEFQTQGELAKHVTRPGAGPGGITLKGPDNDTLIEYLGARPGFETKVVDGRLWVFRQGDKEWAKFNDGVELAKHVTRPGAGPLRSTLKAPDNETILDYLGARPGFVTRVVEGRMWVFKNGSKELAEFDKGGELAKHVTRPGAGPLGTTLKAPDNETIIEFLSTLPGFHAQVVDGRLWVFRKGCKELEEFATGGELAKHVTRPGAGPLGTTLKTPDSETADSFVRVLAMSK